MIYYNIRSSRVPMHSVMRRRWRYTKANGLPCKYKSFWFIKAVILNHFGIQATVSLKFCAHFTKIPNLKFSCPERLADASSRFVSELGPINHSDKIFELYDLRDFILTSQTKFLLWHLTLSVESEFCMRYKIKPRSQEKSFILLSNLTQARTDWRSVVGKGRLGCGCWSQSAGGIKQRRSPCQISVTPTTETKVY